MTRPHILLQVQDLMKAVFDNDDIEITEQTSANDIEEWDSLNHIQLIGEIEEHFDLEFDLEAMLTFENVGDIITQIEKK